MSKLGKPVLCCDTDSVIYVQIVDEPPKVTIGDYVGDLTYDLEEFRSGSFIDEFVSGAQKLGVFGNFPSTGKRTNKCKVGGITLSYENSKVVNLTCLRNMILEDAPPVHVRNPKMIKKKHGGIVVSEQETKEYNVVFKKRRFMKNIDSLPYGY